MMASRRRRNTRKNACCHRLDEQRGARERVCDVCARSLTRWGEREARASREMVELLLGLCATCVVCLGSKIPNICARCILSVPVTLSLENV
jgi:hypothetical protein